MIHGGRECPAQKEKANTPLTTLSVQRQAVEHLFEIDFGAKTSVAFLFPWRAYIRFSQPDPEISTEKFLELAKK